MDLLRSRSAMDEPHLVGTPDFHLNITNCNPVGIRHRFLKVYHCSGTPIFH